MMPLLGSIAGGTPMTNIAYKGWSLFCSLKRAERAFSEETSGLACLPINIQGQHAYLSSDGALGTLQVPKQAQGPASCR